MEGKEERRFQTDQCIVAEDKTAGTKEGTYQGVGIMVAVVTNDDNSVVDVKNQTGHGEQWASGLQSCCGRGGQERKWVLLIMRGERKG